MEQLFATNYLSFADNNEPVLRPYRGRLTPGSPFTINTDEKILLAGGFSHLTPDSHFFLSPTLQLNADLTTLTSAELQTVAQKELMRKQAVAYHSYQVDIDLRVCLIANDATDLDAFIENYGGVLEIEPLLVNQESAEYPTATELRIENGDREYLVHYRSKTPLNQELCTYCGACAQVCPEKCIAPDLTIDYSRCTFCKECEKACTPGALDVYGVEIREMRVPAVILLGECTVELPAETEGIYREDQLPSYFSTLFSAEIKEVVCHNNSICQYSGRLETGCGRCVDICPHGALVRSDQGISIDHSRCEECGKCIAICPTGAMQNSYLQDETLLRYLSGLAMTKAGDLIIGEEQALHSLWWHTPKGAASDYFYFEYPFINSLSFVHLILFFATGFRRVILLAPQKTQHALLEEEAAKANEIVSSLFGHDFAIVTDAASGNTASDDNYRYPLPSPYTSASFENRRALLAEILQHLTLASTNVLQPEKTAPDFLALFCDTEGCTHCLACLNECKVGALKAEQETLSLTYQAGLCVGCGTCVSVCPENVLQLQSVATLDKQFFQRGVLAQAEGAMCRECGEMFGSKKSLERVLTILSQREPINRDHFEYCSKCKVKKLFMAEES